MPVQFAIEHELDEARRRRPWRGQPIDTDPKAPGLPECKDKEQHQCAVKERAPADGGACGCRRRDGCHGCHTHRCRPREGGDPYAVSWQCGTADDELKPRWLWVPAFAGTTDS